MSIDDGHDVIAQLRGERPDICSIPPELARARRARRQSRMLRPLLAGALAIVVVMSGVIAIDGTRPDAPTRVGITEAQARAIAVDALESLTKLQDYEASSTWTQTEIGGRRRVEQVQSTYRREGDNHVVDQAERSDYTGRSVDGIKGLVIDGRSYEEAHTTRVPQHWLLEATPKGMGSAHRLADSDMSSPPNLQTLVQQLEREQLITSRSDDDGNVAVTIRTHVSKLAPASVDPGVPFSDPIGRFAGMVSLLQGNVKQPSDPMIEIRVEARTDGMRRIVATGPTARVHANQRGGTGVIRSTSKVVWEWKPVSDHELVAPDRSDVLVVGKIGAFRRGETGIDGAHGSLDRYTDAEVRQLGRQIARQRRRVLLASAQRRVARDPSIPARWNGMRTAVAAARAEFNEHWLPIDRAALATSDACTPFWPVSRRAMPRATAADAPQDAGWTCTLADGNSSLSVAPDAEAAWLTVAVGSGKHETIMRIELDESR